MIRIAVYRSSDLPLSSLLAGCDPKVGIEDLSGLGWASESQWHGKRDKRVVKPQSWMYSEGKSRVVLLSPCVSPYADCHLLSLTMARPPFYLPVLPHCSRTHSTTFSLLLMYLLTHNLVSHLHVISHYSAPQYAH